MDESIDPKIRPLVDALNAIEGVRTIASCEGHLWRISRPYVYFHCRPSVAKDIAACLDVLQRQGKLAHWWTLTGSFNNEHKLCFVLETPSLSHYAGIFRKFLSYVIRRTQLHNDILRLSQALNNTIDERRQRSRLILPQHKCGTNSGRNQCECARLPFLAGNLSGWIRGFAPRTRFLNIRADLFSTDKTRDQYSHKALLSIGKRTKVARRLVAVMALVAPLGACAGDVELQKDGTGTDEMLRSPCACLPIPYDPAFYRWVG